MPAIEVSSAAEIQNYLESKKVAVIDAYAV